MIILCESEALNGARDLTSRATYEYVLNDSTLYFMCSVMQFNMELLFQLRELFIKYSILLD